MVPAALNLTVNALTDNGPANGMPGGVGAGNAGDLRYCITQAELPANAGSTIKFQAGLTGTIILTNVALPDISQNTTIAGPGYKVITVGGSALPLNPYSIFTIRNGITAEIDGLTIQGGYNLDGGGIYNTGNLTLKEDVIQYNTAVQHGGGIYNGTGASLGLQDDQIYENDADAGGGIFNLGSITSCSDTDPTIIFYNHATTDGGGIYNVGDVDFLGGESIANNTADTTSGSGGGIYNGSTLTLSNVQVLDNDAFHGGGLYNDGTATLDSGTAFDGNQANQGGGLYLQQSSTTTFNTVTVSGNQLVGAAPQAKGIGFVDGAKINQTNLTDMDDPNGQPVQLR